MRLITSNRLWAWGLPDGPNMRMVSRRCSGAIRRMRMCAMGTGMGWCVRGGRALGGSFRRSPPYRSLIPAPKAT